MCECASQSFAAAASSALTVLPAQQNNGATTFALGACDTSLRRLPSARYRRLCMVKKAPVPATDASAEATAGIQHELAARLAEHGESIFSRMF